LWTGRWQLPGPWPSPADRRPGRPGPAGPGKARLVRANGDGWSLIGRTDGPALLVADEIPGIPVDIGDAPQLPELLGALTVAAARSAS